MIIVSIASIAYNIYKKKMSEEKLAKKCCQIAEISLKRKLVKIDNKTIRSIYDQFIFHSLNEEKYLTVLKECFSWDDVVDSSEIHFQKEIIRSELYNDRVQEKLKRNSRFKDFTLLEKKEPKKIEKKPSFWLLLRCFDEYPDELKSPATPIFKPKANIDKLVAVDISELQEISPSEFQEIRGPALNTRLRNALNSELPSILNKNSVSHKEYWGISSGATLRELKTDRSVRVDWLNSVFNFFASEQNEIANEPWLTLDMLFQFCRYGGIDSFQINDKQLTVLYTNFTQGSLIRIINARLFIYELIPKLAKLLYNDADSISREIRLVTEKLFPFLTKNINILMTNSNDPLNTNKPDILQRSFTKVLTNKVKLESKTEDFQDIGEDHKESSNNYHHKTISNETMLRNYENYEIKSNHK